MRFRYCLALILGLGSTAAWSAIQTKSVAYKDYDTVLTGHLYWDDVAKEKRPGVLVVHEWWGLNDYAKKRARMLAELGYVAFAADMYGDQHVTGKEGITGARMDAGSHGRCRRVAQPRTPGLTAAN